MVTAELAACLPVLVLLLAVGLSAVTVASANVHVGDVAREVARLAARHDDVGLQQLVARQSKGLHLSVTPSGSVVVVVATEIVHPLGSALPDVTVSGRAVAALEPTGMP